MRLFWVSVGVLHIEIDASELVSLVQHEAHVQPSFRSHAVCCFKVRPSIRVGRVSVPPVRRKWFLVRTRTRERPLRTPPHFLRQACQFIEVYFVGAEYG